VSASHRKFFLLLFVIVALFQVASIFSPHIEGDELVYLSLSKNMGWDLTNYTVMDVAPLNQFPNRLYREPVFIHPPLFPLILKTGALLINPVLFGILFNGMLKFALAVLMWRFALALGSSMMTAQAVAVFVTACPILGFISSRILIDMSFTLSIVAAIFLLIRSVGSDTYKNLTLAVICICILLNTKIQAVLYLPLFAFLYIMAIRSAFQKQLLTSIALRKQILISILLIGVVGLSHHFRLLLNLGFQECLHILDVEKPFNPFMLRIIARSLPKYIVYLAMIHPIVVILVAPRFWIEVRQSIGNIPDPVLYLGLSILYSTLVTLLLSPAQERYWAHVFPLIFLFIAVLYEKRCEVFKKTGNYRLIYASYIVLLFMNQFDTNVLTAGSRTAIVFPATMKLFPFLLMEGGPFFNF